ncbi:TPA: hypothetical protein H1009_02610 [archaeon]|nr:hypothetical protein [Candidatus Naiadarchaeales archaeon SRR2090153.bin461]
MPVYIYKVSRLNYFVKKILAISILASVFFAAVFANSVFAVDMVWNVKNTIHVENNTRLLEAEIINDLPQDWYSETLTYGTSGDVIEAKQTGGEQCQNFRTYKEGEFTYIECKYGESQFTRGKFFAFSILEKCKCSEKVGISRYVYPLDFQVPDRDSGTMEQIIYAPKGYFLFNNSIRSAKAEETSDGLRITFKEKLSDKQFLSEIYPDFWFHLKKRVDFNNIKTYVGEDFKIEYPAGAEEEINEIAKTMEEALPVVNEYTGRELRDINITIVGETAQLRGFSGWAYPNNLSIYMALDTYPNTIDHELCHLAESPLYYPSWFSEGQAIHCQLRLYHIHGKDEDAKALKTTHFNESQLGTAVNLKEWAPAGEYDSNATQIDRGYAQAYFLWSDIRGVINMTEFFIKAREDFKGYEYTLPNDAVICKMDEVAPSDLLKDFERHGMKLDEPCSEKTYDFIKGPGLIVMALGGLIGLFIFIGIPVLIVWKIRKWWKNRKLKK